MSDPTRKSPGDRPTAAEANALAARAGARRIAAEPPLYAVPPNGLRFARDDPSFWAAVGAVAGTAYPWEQVRLAAGEPGYTAVSGGLAGTTEAKPAYEVNGLVDIPAGSVVRLWPGYRTEDFRFQFLRGGGSPPCLAELRYTVVGCFGNPADGVVIHITGPDGFDHTITTASGSFPGLGTKHGFAHTTFPVGAGDYVATMSLGAETRTVITTVTDCGVYEIAVDMDPADGPYDLNACSPCCPVPVVKSGYIYTPTDGSGAVPLTYDEATGLLWYCGSASTGGWVHSAWVTDIGPPPVISPGWLDDPDVSVPFVTVFSCDHFDTYIREAGTVAVGEHCCNGPLGVDGLGNPRCLHPVVCNPGDSLSPVSGPCPTSLAGFPGTDWVSNAPVDVHGHCSITCVDGALTGFTYNVVGGISVVTGYITHV